MQWNLMDVGITDVRDVIPVMENHFRLWKNFTSPISSFACTTKPCPILGMEDCNGMHLKLNYFGLIKAKILPPCGLLLSVLLIKINDKLMFPLCHTCAMNENQQTCNCLDKDRILVHTGNKFSLKYVSHPLFLRVRMNPHK